MKKLFTSLVILVTVCTKIFAQPIDYDSTFGNNGYLTNTVSSPRNDYRNMLVLDDQKILCIGHKEYTTGTTLIITKFNTDGSLDNTFGTNGIVEYSDSNNSVYFTELKTTSNGKFIVGGAKLYGIDSWPYVVVQFNMNGSVDSSFGTNGMAFAYGYTLWPEQVHSMAVQADGKILLGTYSSLHRFLINGIIDSAYGTNGLGYVEDVLVQGYFSDFACLPDGKTIVCGEKLINNKSHVFCWKLKTDGSLDSSYGVNGVYTYNDTNYIYQPNNIAIQNDKVIICGAQKVSYSSMVKKRIYIKSKY